MDDAFNDVIDDLYNSNHVGVATIQGLFDVNKLRKIRNVLASNAKQFYQLKFGNVTRWDLIEDDFHKYPALAIGREQFRRITKRIASVTEINPVYLEKFSVMFYPEGSSGVKSHRDSEHSVNCVVVFVISGTNTFFAAKDTACKDVIEFPAQAGDAVLMRGPRSTEDMLSRPIHYVGKVQKPRYVMICRHINLKGLKSQI